jgi:phytoene dehydrogenase-like protein
MPHRLLRFALSRRHPEPRMFRRPERLKPGYDVVIIGDGGHGLAAAYYLAREHGITDVCVLEKGWLGGGRAAGAGTAVRRAPGLPGAAGGRLHRDCRSGARPSRPGWPKHCVPWIFPLHDDRHFDVR